MKKIITVIAGGLLLAALCFQHADAQVGAYPASVFALQPQSTPVAFKGFLTAGTLTVPCVYVTTNSTVIVQYQVTDSTVASNHVAEVFTSRVKNVSVTIASSLTTDTNRVTVLIWP